MRSHFRLIILGEHQADLMVRLDSVLYHPLMEFNTYPDNCIPHCFPAGQIGKSGLGVAGIWCIELFHSEACGSGCVKMCTPKAEGSCRYPSKHILCATVLSGMRADVTC